MNSNRVCSSCFSDPDLRDWVRENGGPRGCGYCGKHDSPTADLEDVVTRIESCIERYYGRAVDQMSFCSAEGGYLGKHWDSWDMLDKVGLALPRDSDGRLHGAIVRKMRDEPWCAFDVGALDLDDALWTSWERFCNTIKHQRRFFFHASGRDSQDSLTPASLLNRIAIDIENLGLVVDLSAGLGLWRARPDLAKRRRVSASDFGPPPIEFALQSNRMNAAGIPMLYLASSATTAVKETRVEQAKVGLWRSQRSIRVLDLRRLPPVPTVFSDEPRALAHTIRFLHNFSDDIMKPVARNNSVHIEYLPSQVVTEFMRDYKFSEGPLDGVAYGSTVHPRGWNIAFFLGPVELGLTKPEWGTAPPQTFIFEKSTWATSS
ncbi:RES domain-containing protein [Duganella sp. CY15W]|uniref:HEPN-associated N-terminal domain-containing protein n=1 Tax=Duganella sp. CY15W TaxID=2692172 RepID=UPI001371A5A8|nr:RES domain-containing protein [Duganella sp. CY15W]